MFHLFQSLHLKFSNLQSLKEICNTLTVTHMANLKSLHYKWHEPKSNLAQHETVLSLLKSPLFSLFPFLTQWTKGKKNFFDWSHMKKETGNRGPTCGTEFEAHAIIFYLFLALCRCWGLTLRSRYFSLCYLFIIYDVVHLLLFFVLFYIVR